MQISFEWHGLDWSGMCIVQIFISSIEMVVYSNDLFLLEFGFYSENSIGNDVFHITLNFDIQLLGYDACDFLFNKFLDARQTQKQQQHNFIWS